MTEAAVETDGLTRDFGGGRGILDLSLQVRRGETLGLIGPNGAGKTTTIRLLLDLIRPDRGRALLLGLDSHRDAVAIHRRTGYLPGEAPDYPNHTGQRILDQIAHLRGGVEPSRISHLAEEFDLDLGRRYRQYSHGNRQKLWLIQALMHEPDLLILDEPTNGLDPLMQQSFRRLLREACSRGATVLLSSHVLPEVEELCDRIAVVHAGRLCQVGTMDELRLGAQRRVTAQLAEPVDPVALSRLDGVSAVEVSDHTLHCTVAGEMEPLLQVLVGVGVHSLEATQMSLEELFLSTYGQSGN